MNDRIKVWDPFVRVFHWLLLAAFVTSYLTGDEETDLHFYSGYFILALLVLRIVWGFVGSEYALFRNLVVSPTQTVGYLEGLVTGNVKHYLGHNPAATMMILALLGSVLLTAGTGLTLHGFHGEGPLAFALTIKPAGAPLTEAEIRAFQERTARRSHEEQEEEEAERHEAFGDEYEGGAIAEGGARLRFSPAQRQELHSWKEIHEFFVNLTILLIVLHVGGVLASSWRHRENLIKAMLDGFKRKDAAR